MIMQVPQFILAITVEHEINVWHAIHLATAGVLFRWKDHARVEFTFTRGFGHVPVAIFTICGNPNKVFSTDNWAQLTFR